MKATAAVAISWVCSCTVLSLGCQDLRSGSMAGADASVAVVGDSGADTTAIPSATLMDAAEQPRDVGAGSIDSQGAAACLPQCEAYQSCVSGVCTPRYRRTTSGPPVGNVEEVLGFDDGATTVVGKFVGSVTLGIGPSLQTLVASTSSSSTFIARFNGSGDLVWAHKVEGRVIFSDWAAGHNGDTVAVGSFYNSVVFPPQTPKTASVGADSFVMRIRPSGVVTIRVWEQAPELDAIAKKKGSSGYWLGGSFYEGLRLEENGFGFAAPEGETFGFLASLSEDLVADTVQVFATEGRGEFFVSEIAPLNSGGAWIVGRAKGKIDFDPGGSRVERVLPYSSRVAVRVDPAGAYRANAVIEQEPNEYSADGPALGLLDDGLIMSGWIWVDDGPVDLDPSEGTVLRRSAGQYDFFVTNIAADATYRWGHVWGGAGDDYLNSMAALSGGDIMLSGKIEGTVNLGTSGRDVFVSAAQGSAFVLRLSPSGGYLSHLNVGGPAAWGRLAQTGGGFVLGGRYSGIGDFDPGAGLEQREGDENSLFLSWFDW